MIDTLTTREVTLDDIDTIVAHRRAMFEDMGYTDETALDAMDARYRVWVADKIERDVYLGWLVEDEEQVIAAGVGVWIQEWQPLPADTSERRGYVLNVYTARRYRRRGLARHLMTMLLDACRNQGIISLYLHSSDEASHLYESMGFEQTHELRLILNHSSQT